MLTADVLSLSVGTVLSPFVFLSVYQYRTQSVLTRLGNTFSYPNRPGSTLDYLTRYLIRTFCFDEADQKISAF